MSVTIRFPSVSGRAVLHFSLKLRRRVMAARSIGATKTIIKVKNGTVYRVPRLNSELELITMVSWASVFMGREGGKNRSVNNAPFLFHARLKRCFKGRWNNRLGSVRRAGRSEKRKREGGPFRETTLFKSLYFSMVTRNPLNRGFLWNGVWNWSTECFEIIGLFLLGVRVCERGAKFLRTFVSKGLGKVVINKRRDFFWFDIIYCESNGEGKCNRWFY